jgi:hypothetical protein
MRRASRGLRRGQLLGLLGQLSQLHQERLVIVVLVFQERWVVIRIVVGVVISVVEVQHRLEVRLEAPRVPVYGLPVLSQLSGHRATPANSFCVSELGLVLGGGSAQLRLHPSTTRVPLLAGLS